MWKGFNTLDRSRHIVEGFGGVNQTLLKVREAIDKGEYQWASELATYILKVDPQNTEAKLLKAHALRVVGQRFTAMDGRTWYLTTALDLEGKITVDPNAVAVTSPEQLASLPIDNLLEILSTKLDPVKSNGVNKTLGLNITGCGQRLYTPRKKQCARCHGHTTDKPRHVTDPWSRYLQVNSKWNLESSGRCRSRKGKASR